MKKPGKVRKIKRKMSERWAIFWCHYLGGLALAVLAVYLHHQYSLTEPDPEKNMQFLFFVTIPVVLIGGCLSGWKGPDGERPFKLDNE